MQWVEVVILLVVRVPPGRVSHLMRWLKSLLCAAREDAAGASGTWDL